MFCCSFLIGTLFEKSCLRFHAKLCRLSSDLDHLQGVVMSYEIEDKILHSFIEHRRSLLSDLG